MKYQEEKKHRKVEEKRMVNEDLSEEVTLSPDWKDKERTSYEQMKEG